MITVGEVGAGSEVGRTGLSSGSKVVSSKAWVLIKASKIDRLSVGGGRLVMGLSLSSMGFMVVLALGGSPENSWSKLSVCMSS